MTGALADAKRLRIAAKSPRNARHLIAQFLDSKLGEVRAS